MVIAGNCHMAKFVKLSMIFSPLIPYKWKYWQALNSAIWLQTGHSEILVKF